MTLEEQIKAKYTPEQIRQKVLDNVWDVCDQDGGYLRNLIEWAHRDYKAEDYLNDFVSMELEDQFAANSSNNA